MSNSITVTVIAEGQTEQIFIRDILAPYLGAKNIFMTSIVLTKPGQNGGDVRFVRAKNDIGRHLKQRADTYVSLLVDYYGIGRDWPGLESVVAGASPMEIAYEICTATQRAVDAELSDQDSRRRFIPYVSVYEFEALLFSNAATLAGVLRVPQRSIDEILAECVEPERIDNSPYTAPSKRIEGLCGHFKKTTNGIAVAQAIGVKRMREKCPVFNDWINRLEALR